MRLRRDFTRPERILSSMVASGVPGAGEKVCTGRSRQRSGSAASTRGIQAALHPEEDLVRLHHPAGPPLTTRAGGRPGPDYGKGEIPVTPGRGRRYKLNSVTRRRCALLTDQNLHLPELAAVCILGLSVDNLKEGATRATKTAKTASGPQTQARLHGQQGRTIRSTWSRTVTSQDRATDCDSDKTRSLARLRKEPGQTCSGSAAAQRE
jgi:hypothetical protein